VSVNLTVLTWCLVVKYLIFSLPICGDCCSWKRRQLLWVWDRSVFSGSRVPQRRSVCQKEGCYSGRRGWNSLTWLYLGIRSHVDNAEQEYHNSADCIRPSWSSTSCMLQLMFSQNCRSRHIGSLRVVRAFVHFYPPSTYYWGYPGVNPRLCWSAQGCCSVWNKGGMIIQEVKPKDPALLQCHCLSRIFVPRMEPTSSS
jgi:hypothetical protein